MRPGRYRRTALLAVPGVERPRHSATHHAPPYLVGSRAMKAELQAGCRSRTASSIRCAVMVSPAALSVKDSLSRGQSCGNQPAPPADRGDGSGAAGLIARPPRSSDCPSSRACRAHTRVRHTVCGRPPELGRRRGPGGRLTYPDVSRDLPPSQRSHPSRSSLAAARCCVIPIILQRMPYQ